MNKEVLEALVFLAVVPNKLTIKRCKHSLLHPEEINAAIL
jgi:hypothetical protein